MFPTSREALVEEARLCRGYLAKARHNQGTLGFL